MRREQSIGSLTYKRTEGSVKVGAHQSLGKHDIKEAHYTCYIYITYLLSSFSNHDHLEGVPNTSQSCQLWEQPRESLQTSSGRTLGLILMCLDGFSLKLQTWEWVHFKLGIHSITKYCPFHQRFTTIPLSFCKEYTILGKQLITSKNFQACSLWFD